MRTRIVFLAQPESMRSIIGATQPERRLGSAKTRLVFIMLKPQSIAGFYNSPFQVAWLGACSLVDSMTT